jgi:outer membrane protein OmpA-like peptidoglycan-associated protein
MRTDFAYTDVFFIQGRKVMKRFRLWVTLSAALSVLMFSSYGNAAAEPDPAGQGAAFDINSVPVSDKELGAFPFFTPPSGSRYATHGSSKLDEKKSTRDFDRYYFVLNQTTLRPVEGKSFRVELWKEATNSPRDPDILRIERNYENAIAALGGVRVFDGKPDRKTTYGALSEKDRDAYGPRDGLIPRQTHVIRKPGLEIWFEVSCAYASCYYSVVQQGEMQQTVGLIPASEMKTALDKEGHIALYINFDVDKAIIKPDSQSTIEEITKLLETYPDLKIRIEGHTDSTGEAAHNQTLSEKRAASVFGSLLARGIEQNRLVSQGFGASKPIADNKTEEGRAKNRRVEIVKTSP